MIRPVVIHAIRGFLAPTETFVGNQLTTLRKYTSVALAHHRSPNREFDIKHMYIINERSNGVSRLFESAAYATLKAMMPYDVQAAAQWLEPFDPALWHFHFIVDAAFFLPLLRKVKLPSVVSLYGYDVSEFPTRLAGLGLRYIRRVFDEIDLFLVMTEDMKRDAIRLGIPPEKVFVHYHGINARRFRYDARTYSVKDEFNILCVGTLEMKKGQHHLLNTLAELRRTHPEMNAKVRLVGKGPLQQRLEGMMREKDLNNHVELAGYVPHMSDRLLQYYRDADVFVHFSSTQPTGDKEGIPGTIVEAMASGLPIVTTRHAGIPEVITDGEHGILLDEWDSNGIAGSLVRLWEDQQSRCRLGKAAAQRALTELDVQAKTEALERIYDSMLGRAIVR